MTKIFEALEHAGLQKRTAAGSPCDVVLHEEVSLGPSKLGVEGEMLCLYKSIESLLPELDRRIIMFIGSRQGEGTSTIIREFAMVAAGRIGKSVLLLDADRFNPTHQYYFNIRSKTGWQDVIKNHDLSRQAFHRVEDTPLFVSPSSNSNCSTPEMFDALKLHDFWKSIWEEFELILIDSPPLAVSPDGLAIAPRVDGVVLVVEAEKTRWNVVNSVKDRIATVGGNILGVAFNKRRYYIPQSIYDRL
jgi:protein-tyrosine kinase